MNDRTDIVHNVLDLSTLVVEGDTEGCQGLEGSLYINFGPTRDTYMNVGKPEINEVLNKTKDLFSWSWHARIVWTLVESINNNVDRALSWVQEHLLQASCQGIFNGPLSAIVMFRMKSRKYIPAKIRLGGKLPEVRDDKVA